MLSALELSNLIEKINAIIRGKNYYVTKIQPILEDTYLFKLHHAFEHDISMMISTRGVWITKNIFESNIKPYFLASLNRLVRCKVIELKQFNNDRIIRIKFYDKVDDEDIILNLIVELFSHNMYLCDSNMIIISMLKNKRFSIGSRYYALDNRIDPFNIRYEDLYPSISQNIERWMMDNIALPKSIIDMIICDAEIDNVIKEEEMHRLYNSLIKIRDEFRYGSRSLLVKDLDNYLDEIDDIFSKMIYNELTKFINRDIEEKRKKIIDDIKSKEEQIIMMNNKAKMLRDAASRILTNNAKEEDLSIIRELGLKGSLYAQASALYDNAKSIEKGIKRIRESIEKDKKELSSISLNTIDKKQERTKTWFERYRWFITSDGLLTIGGRDASSNAILLKRYAEGKDLIFHTDIHGSPFFILKEAKENSIQEVATATASFSKAWREGISAIDVYYVMRDQISATNINGTFKINGKRNYIKNVELRLGVGFIEFNNKKFLVAAPVKSFNGKCIIIKPGRSNSKEDAARDLAKRLDVTLDDLLSILPNGGIEIL